MTTNAAPSLSERQRGFREFQQFDALRAMWPIAFPDKSHEVRPLASGAKQAAVDGLGWNAGYGRAVLRSWALQPAYCRAVLRYATRINLDGSASEEAVDDEARAMATERLEQIAARPAKDIEKLRAGTEAMLQVRVATDMWGQIRPLKTRRTRCVYCS